MTRKFFSLALYALAFAAVLIATLVTLYSFLLKDLKHYTDLSLEHIKKRTGYTIALDDIRWSLFRGAGLEINNLRIRDPEKNLVLFRCRKLYLLPELLPLLQKKLIVSRFILNDPEATITRNSSGQIDFFTLPFKRLDKFDKIDNLFYFSITLNQIYINNAKVAFHDDLNHISHCFEQVDLFLRKRALGTRYDLTAGGRTTPLDSAGDIALSASFSLDPSAKGPNGLRGQASLTFKSLPARSILAYLPNWLPAVSESTRLDADIALTLLPGFEYASSGRFSLRKMAFTAGGTNRFQPVTCSFQYSASGSPKFVLCDSFELQVPSGIQAAGNFQVAELHLPEPLLTANIKTAFFEIDGRTMDFVSAFGIPAHIKPLVSKVRSARVTLNGIRLSARLAEPFRLQDLELSGELLLEDTAVSTAAFLPDLNIQNARITLDNSTLSARASASLLPGDRHEISADIPWPYTGSDMTARISSRLPAASLKQLLDSLPGGPAEWLRFTSGTVDAESTLGFRNAGKILVDSNLNLTGAGYLLADTIGKPEGASNTVHFETAFSAGEPFPGGWLSFLYDDQLQMEGDLQLFPDFKFQGLCRLENFDLSSLVLPAFPPKLGIKGLLSGQATVHASQPLSERVPMRGSLRVDGFELYDLDNRTSLVKADADCILNGNRPTIKYGSFKVGKSDFALSGSLDTLLPPAGTLRADAGLFDIDDFVHTIHTIKQASRKHPSRADGNKTSIFMNTDLLFDLNVLRVNILEWDGKNGRSKFTYKGGVMRWDDITVYAEPGGRVEGAVVYDFSDAGAGTLKLIPTRSEVPVTWAIPKLGAKKTVTGTLDLRGEFTSTFTKASEIISNMTGQYSVCISDGKIDKFTVLSKILTLLNIASLVMLKSADPLSTGLPFSSIKSNFRLKNGMMHTDDFLLTSASLNLSAVGDIDAINDQLDLMVGVQVFRTIAKVLDKIPIAGDMLTGPGDTLTIGYFRVSGPIGSSTVRPKPLKAVDETILRIFTKILRLPMDILEFPLGVIKKQTQPPAATPPDAAGN